MKKANWKDVAELIGITAIVASLIFVGMQMRQAQRIAEADSYQQQVAAALATSELAVMLSDFVAKANRGEELTDAESFALSQYVIARWQVAFFSSRRSEFLDRPRRGPAGAFAKVLCENPGLIKFWESEASTLRAIDPRSSVPIFTNEVDMNVDRLCGQ